MEDPKALRHQSRRQ